MCSPKVSKGRSESPLVAPAGAKSPAYGERTAIRSRPSGATQHGWSKEQLGGASEDARSYWQGRFAACAFCWRLPLNWSPAERLGRCPKPHQRRRLWTPQGALPLDPFLRPGLSAFPCYPLSLIRLSFPQHYSKKSFHEQPLAEASRDIILRPLIPRHREQLIRRPNFHHIP